MVRVESEHSAMAVAIGASATGARAYTATSSQGLLYMYENLWWAANARLPIVATFVTRALAPPWSIWSDHQDFLTLRDSGWILFMVKDAQEAYDLTIQAFKIAENTGVRLPVGVAYDAFVISHTAEPVELLNQDEADNFLPDPRNIEPLLDVEKPCSLGNLPKSEYHYLLRKNLWDNINEAKKVIHRVGEEYGELTGRDYSRFIECYRCDDADTIFISMGAIAGEGMDAVDELREKGHKVGHATIRLFRPFPSDELISLAKETDKLIIFSRGLSNGKSGILYDEVASTLYREGLTPETYDIVVGLAGTEVSNEDFKKVYKDVSEGKLNNKKTIFVRRREYV